MQRRLGIAILESSYEETALSERIPVSLRAVYEIDGDERVATLIDTTPTGALMQTDDASLQAGADLDLDVGGMGRLHTHIEASTANGFAVRFGAEAPALFRSLVDRQVALDQQIISLAQSTAGLISRRFANAVADGEISMEDLFDTDYQPVEGSDPQQHLVRYLGFTDEALPPIRSPFWTPTRGSFLRPVSTSTATSRRTT